MQNAADLPPCADGHSRFCHDNGIALQMRGYFGRCRINKAEISMTITTPRRGAHRNENGICFGDSSLSL